MNNSDFKDKSSPPFIGKELIIVIVVIFSALSFTLGFFVGKSTIDKNPAPAAQMEEIIPPIQNQEPVSVQSVTPEEMPLMSLRQNVVVATEQSQTSIQGEQQKSSAASEKKGVEPVKEIPKEPLDKNTKHSKESVSSHEPSAKSKTAKNDIIYTVQMGAFKNASEAENFMKKYNKKGYKIYTVISKNKKYEKIYKIRTGEFTEKKDAEVLCLKLKKTEGINSFVAFKNE